MYQIQIGLAHLHARLLGATQNLISTVDRRCKLDQMLFHFSCGNKTCVSFGVALRANGLVVGSDKLVRRDGRCRDCCGRSRIREGRLTRRPLCAGFLQIAAPERRDKSADILHRRKSRRSGAVIAMAGGAGRCAQVAANGQRFMMDARAVVGELIGWDAVLLHVAASAWQREQVLATLTGLTVERDLGRAKIVHAVAIDANSYLAIAGSQALAVNAGVVLLN